MNLKTAAIAIVVLVFLGMAWQLKVQLKRVGELEIKLETGRHHQIRAQLAGIGSVIKGDRKYGAKRSNKNGGISLHARKISFIHPVKGERLEVIAPYPKMDIYPVFFKKK